MTTEFHVFLVTGDHLSGPHRTRTVADSKAKSFRANCPCGGNDPECAADDFGAHGVGVSKTVDGYGDNNPGY